MRLIDLYFRAFRNYRKYTQNNSDSQKERKIIRFANMKDDQLTSIKYTCEIDEVWINNIEEGLKYIEKAIREERQFILSQGEVVNIEKVKRTSKDSVYHLARHSNLITRTPKEKESIVPEKLYMVEKLSDFAVYENRFLYMLLYYLREFITVRIDKIKSQLTTYKSNMTICKEIKLNDRHINYHLTYSDENFNDPYLLDAYQQIPSVNRIENIYSIVLALLRTPLMKEVAKAPMIKPPIIKTNVLRMNQNFKAALQLYYYITSYDKDGFTFKEVKKTYNPFPDDMADEFAETISLTSFLTYSYGNDIKQDLKEAYEIEEKRIKEQEEQKAIEEIKRLKKRLTEMNLDPSDYILTLEKRNNFLEKMSSDLEIEKQKNSEYKLRITDLENEMEDLKDSLNKMQSELIQKNDEINNLNKKYFDDMYLGEQVHREEIRKLLDKHKNEINDLNKQHSNEQETMTKIFKKTIFNLNREIENLKKQINELNIKLHKEEEERRANMARYHALKQQYGLFTDKDDFTSREDFKELELEMIAFKQFFNEQWRKTKKKIRENVKQKTFSTIGKKQTNDNIFSEDKGQL